MQTKENIVKYNENNTFSHDENVKNCMLKIASKFNGKKLNIIEIFNYENIIEIFNNENIIKIFNNENVIKILNNEKS